MTNTGAKIQLQRHVGLNTGNTELKVLTKVSVGPCIQVLIIHVKVSYIRSQFINRN